MSPTDAASELAQRQRERVFYTWSAQNRAVPLEIVSGQGARFETADGARWFDLGSMTWNATLGHGHPRMRRALAAAAERGLLVLECGKKAIRFAPPLILTEAQAIVAAEVFARACVDADASAVVHRDPSP